MRAEEFGAWIRRQPFEPIRVRLSDGRTYEISHPDQVIVQRACIDIGIPVSQDSPVMDRVDRCSLLHVVSIEPLNAEGRKDNPN